MNKLLQRQIRKYISDYEANSPALSQFLMAVSEAYDNFDKDRRLIERTLDISSEELRQSNKLLQTEINERKKAEENILKSHTILQQMIDSMPFGVVVIGKDKIIKKANSIAQSLSRYSEEELLGQSCHKTLCPAEVNQCPILDKKQTIDNSERTLITKDKKKVPIIKSVIPLTLGDEDVLLETFVDITEHKKAIAALYESEERFRALTEHSPDVIMRFDRQHRHTYVNPAVQGQTGLLPEEFIGKTHHEMGFPEDLCNLTKEAIEKVFLTGRTNRIEFQLPSGIWIDWFLVPEYDSSGNVKAVMTSSRDITKLKLNEQKQAELYELLEQANQDLKDFAYIVSHDLKAPLRGISTLVQWITADYAEKLDEEGREQLKLLSTRVDRMHNLIEGVLEYSRVGRVNEEHIQVNLNDVIYEIIDMISPPENITISVVDELPTIECGKTRIMQVFQNLLSNAVKYMDKPEGLIQIGCTEMEDCWQFSIADNGPGIEEKYFEKIFQIFQTLTARDTFESTGIGLTVTKRIVELYGGRIWLESTPKEGTTFFFTILKQFAEITNAEYETNNVS